MRELTLTEVEEVNGAGFWDKVAGAAVSIAVNEIYEPLSDFLQDDWNDGSDGMGYGNGYSYSYYQDEYEYE